MGYIIYSFIYNFICLGYLCIYYKKYIFLRQQVWKIMLNYLSGLGNPEILMNIMWFRGFSRFTISTVITTFFSALVTYYLLKGVLLLKKKKAVMKINQKKFSSKSMLLHYMTKTEFWCVKHKFYQFLKHLKMWFQDMCMISISIIIMIKFMLNYISNSFIFLANSFLKNLNMQSS